MNSHLDGEPFFSRTLRDPSVRTPSFPLIDANRCPACAAPSGGLPCHLHVSPGEVRAFWDDYSLKSKEELEDSFRMLAGAPSTPGCSVLQLLGDTGAFDHMMDEKEARRHGFPVWDKPHGDHVVVSTANGPVECTTGGQRDDGGSVTGCTHAVHTASGWTKHV